MRVPDAMRVLVRPCYDYLLHDKLFEMNALAGWHCFHPFVEARRMLATRGVEMSTWDTRPLADADVIFFLDLPHTPAEVERAVAEAPRAKKILQIIETPLSRRHFLLPANHKLFDVVITYSPDLVRTGTAAGGAKHYVHYDLCVERPAEAIADIPFGQRKVMGMINSNRWSQPWRCSRTTTGLAGLPGVGPMFSGWSCGIGTTLAQTGGQLYDRRRRIARLAEEYPDGTLEVWGPGWQGEKSNWVHRFISNRPFKVGKGKHPRSKWQTLADYRFGLAFENLVNTDGYVSEKIFDCLLAGVVPVYLGEPRIASYVPAECFVDARRFKNDREMLDYVAGCGEAEWRTMRDAGRAFAASAAFDRFLPPVMGEKIATALELATGAALPTRGVTGGVAV